MMRWYEESSSIAKNKLNKHIIPCIVRELIISVTSYHNLCKWKCAHTWIHLLWYISPFSNLDSDRRRQHLSCEAHICKKRSSGQSTKDNAVGKKIIHTNDGGVLWHSVTSTEQECSTTTRLHTNTTTSQRCTYSASSICLPHPAQVAFPHDLHSSFQHIVTGLFLYLRFDSIGFSVGWWLMIIYFACNKAQPRVQRPAEQTSHRWQKEERYRVKITLTTHFWKDLDAASE